VSAVKKTVIGSTPFDSATGRPRLNVKRRAGEALSLDLLKNESSAGLVAHLVGGQGLAATPTNEIKRHNLSETAG